MVERDAWVSGCCPASAEHLKRMVQLMLAAQGGARMQEVPAVAARPAGEHWVAWETLEVQQLGKVVLLATLPGVGQTTEAVSALQVRELERSVLEVVEEQCDSARHLRLELVVVWADRWYH